MTKTKSEKKALVEETAKAFTVDTRCAVPRPDRGDLDTCRYHMDGKQGCAIGRLLPIELREKLDQRLEDGMGSSVCATEVFRMLPDDLRAYGQPFMIRLQSLHDRKRNWESGGLSILGKEELSIMIKDIDNDVI